MEFKSEKSQNKPRKDIISTLPVDVFFNILSRLPIKTISLCKWVSKLWFNLLLNPRFAKLHYAKSLENRSISVIIRGFSDEFHLIDHQQLDNFQTLVSSYPLDFKGFQENFTLCGKFRNSYELIGIVNGLIGLSPVCDEFYVADPCYVCNPITREYVILPKSPKIDMVPLALGFGFDSITDDYKVIRILITKKESKIEDNEVEDENVVEVFTLGSREWRQVAIEVPHIRHVLQHSGVFVNGRIHWLGYTNTGSSEVILSFNVATEEFDILLLPVQLLHSGFSIWRRLLVLGDCLGLYCGHYGGRNIWVMKDYGVHDSWAKQCNISTECGNLYASLNSGYLQLQNGELLLLVNDTIGYYDLQRNVFKRIRIANLESHLEFHLTMLSEEKPGCETFVPLPRIKEMNFGIELSIFLVGSLISPKNGHGETLDR
ncbi:hypothetical protein ACHQM5_024909 [Ranunculus cassubicifolius]